MNQPNSIKIDEVEYVRKDSISGTVDPNGFPYVLVRTKSAGVHAGFLKERNNQEVTLLDSRRIWYWEGAATLSQLAEEGTSKPDKCKFPQEVGEILLLEVIEIIKTTAQAKTSIKKVKPWRV